MQWTFVIGICVTLTLCIFMPDMRRTALTFAALWAAQTGFVLLTGLYDPWWLFAITNLGGAFFIMRHPAFKIQAAVGSLLIFQSLIDCGYGLAGNRSALISYIEYQTHIGWLIMLLMVGWYGGNCIRRVRNNRGIPRSQTRISGVAK